MNLEQLYGLYLKYPSVQTDTRKLQENDLFFALKGANFNGNKFAQKAIDDGAAYAIVDEAINNTDDRFILVHDVLETLQQLARHHREQLKIPFIAITGSNGKTTTKELTHIVLSTQYKTYTTPGNLNNHIGVPLTVLKIKYDAQIAVIEMGANHLGEIASYCRIALPNYGLITNCGKAHLEGFGSEEGVRKGKGELYDHLRDTRGTAFIMWEYDYLQTMSKGIQYVVKYGTKDADIVGDAIENEPFLKVAFRKGFAGEIKTNLIGNYNLPNVLAAAAIAKYFDITDENFKGAISNYIPSNNRSQLIEKNGIKIILDAYNANPSSMIPAIKSFAEADDESKILCLGAMAELGEESLKEHKNLVDFISNYNWTDVLLVGGDFIKLNSAFKKFDFVAEAGEYLQKSKLKETSILIKGSRTTQMEKILDYI